MKEIARVQMLIRPEALVRAADAFANATDSADALQPFHRAVQARHFTDDEGRPVRVSIIVETWP